MSARFDAGRRHFLKVSALVGGALAIGVYLLGCDRRPSEPPKPKAEPAAAQRFASNAWVRITPDDMVTIVVDKSEMGQGLMTSMPMLVAEALGADWQRMKLVQAPADPAYRKPKIGIQATGGSTSVSSSWKPLRRAGATTRAMLVAAAAREWQVTPESCRMEKGKVLHPDSGRQARYGELPAWRRASRCRRMCRSNRPRISSSSVSRWRAWTRWPRWTAARFSAST
ncbi:MAG: molybdopterin cofactor-binding domain-containing protein [Pseudomonadota bacterium]